MERQKTIANSVSLSGPGLFSGETTTLTFSPAAVGSGITFIREQDDKSATIVASVSNILRRPRRTCLHNGTLFVETIEHCMAALSGLKIDNAVVRVAGGKVGEVPGGDGSSKTFVDALVGAGVVEQDAQLEPLIIRKPIEVSIGDASLAALPGPTDRLDVIYDFRSTPRLWAASISASPSARTILSRNWPPLAPLSPSWKHRSCATAAWESISPRRIFSSSPRPA